MASNSLLATARSGRREGLSRSAGRPASPSDTSSRIQKIRSCNDHNDVLTEARSHRGRQETDTNEEKCDASSSTVLLLVLLCRSAPLWEHCSLIARPLTLFSRGSEGTSSPPSPLRANGVRVEADQPVSTDQPSSTPTTMLAVAARTRMLVDQCRLRAIAIPAMPLTSSDTSDMPPIVPTPNASR